MAVNFAVPICCRAVLLEMALALLQQVEERVQFQQQQLCYSLYVQLVCRTKHCPMSYSTASLVRSNHHRHL